MAALVLNMHIISRHECLCLTGNTVTFTATPLDLWYLRCDLQGGKGTPGPKGDDGDAGDPGPDVSLLLIRRLFFNSRSIALDLFPHLSSITSCQTPPAGGESHVPLCGRVSIFLSFLSLFTHIIIISCMFHGVILHQSLTYFSESINLALTPSLCSAAGNALLNRYEDILCACVCVCACVCLWGRGL